MPWRELRAFMHIFRLYRQVRPDIVHHVALKPVVYGSIAAWLARVPHVVNAMTGLGFVFSSNHWKARCLRPGIKRMFTAFLNRANSRLIVQNSDDADLFRHQIGIDPSRIALIRGSGVDTSHYPFLPAPRGPMTFTLVGRMLRDKGVYEFVAASRILRSKGIHCRCILVGDVDQENPASIDASQLKQWEADGFVEWWGRRDDIASVWAKSHVAVLPSYREGLPKSLLEAASCGRPLIACDVPGCREVVHQGVNGLLVQSQSAEALAAAMEALAADVELRERMGRASRKIVESDLSEDIVIRQTLALYDDLLVGQ